MQLLILHLLKWLIQSIGSLWTDGYCYPTQPVLFLYINAYIAEDLRLFNGSKPARVRGYAEVSHSKIRNNLRESYVCLNRAQEFGEQFLPYGFIRS